MADMNKMEDGAKSMWHNAWHPKGTGKNSPKKWWVAMLLVIFLGWAGGHRWYTGKTITAIIQLCTLGGGFVWWIMDVIRVATNKWTDEEGNIISRK